MRKLLKNCSSWQQLTHVQYVIASDTSLPASLPPYLPHQDDLHLIHTRQPGRGSRLLRQSQALCPPSIDQVLHASHRLYEVMQQSRCLSQVWRPGDPRGSLLNLPASIPRSLLLSASTRGGSVTDATLLHADTSRPVTEAEYPRW